MKYFKGEIVKFVMDMYNASGHVIGFTEGTQTYEILLKNNIVITVHEEDILGVIEIKRIEHLVKR